ncbi:hypothetical protein QI30_11785 [Kurthia sp. 3B1D]|uniref:DUF2653 domain-containing protein n=2 Tax=Kurthia TaxID=1649 RepID=A0A433RTU8_9BACL|nr:MULTISPECIES: DUF2653 family protein [unclassified Kurthia]RUS55597.1 hypothetical protein QI30_11785 [Kurthia sp. 3B1D]
MEQLILDEQEVINALCTYHARQKNLIPEDVMIELMYDDHDGREPEEFGAEAEVDNEVVTYQKGDMIQAIRNWVNFEYNIDQFSAIVKLAFNEEQGIYAIVE